MKYFCNKCGYGGNEMSHDSKDGQRCNYFAALSDWDKANEPARMSIDVTPYSEALNRIAALERDLAAMTQERDSYMLLSKMRPAPQADMVPAEELAAAQTRAHDLANQVMVAWGERDEAMAEAAALRVAVASVYTTAYMRGHYDTIEGNFTNVLPVDHATYFANDAAEELDAAIEARKEGV